MPALESSSVLVDDDVAGLQWGVDDFEELTKLIAIITLGQAEHASRIIRNLESNEPALSRAELFSGARGQLKIRGDTDEKRKVSKYHRDGFLFECMSWIVARQSAGERTYLKDPHITSTTQGLDGLMIEMHPTDPEIINATIFEDKCTDNPRGKFHQEVMPTFTDHHQSKRSRELIANAVSLIKESGLNGTAATLAAERVLDKQFRTYRAALTVASTMNSAAMRAALFKGYKNLADITKAQRVGAMFMVDSPLREWFQKLAEGVTSALDNFENPDV